MLVKKNLLLTLVFALLSFGYVGGANAQFLREMNRVRQSTQSVTGVVNDATNTIRAIDNLNQELGSGKEDTVRQRPPSIGTPTTTVEQVYQNWRTEYDRNPLKRAVTNRLVELAVDPRFRDFTLTDLMNAPNTTRAVTQIALQLKAPYNNENAIRAQIASEVTWLDAVRHQYPVLWNRVQNHVGVGSSVPPIAETDIPSIE